MIYVERMTYVDFERLIYVDFGRLIYVDEWSCLLQTDKM